MVKIDIVDKLKVVKTLMQSEHPEVKNINLEILDEAIEEIEYLRGVNIGECIKNVCKCK